MTYIRVTFAKITVEELDRRFHHFARLPYSTTSHEENYFYQMHQRNDFGGKRFMIQKSLVNDNRVAKSTQ